MGSKVEPTLVPELYKLYDELDLNTCSKCENVWLCTCSECKNVI